jgi:hypothetical protein
MTLTDDHRYSSSVDRVLNRNLQGSDLTFETVEEASKVFSSWGITGGNAPAETQKGPRPMKTKRPQQPGLLALGLRQR